MILAERYQNVTVPPKWELALLEEIFLEELCLPMVASNVICTVGKQKWQQNKFLLLLLSPPDHREVCLIMNAP